MQHKTIIDLFNENYPKFGFDDIGYLPYQKMDAQVCCLQKWIESGYAAEMDYLRRSLDIRGDITNILPDAKSVVVLIRGYRPTTHSNPGNPLIASYAQMEDYHNSIKRDINNLLKTIQLTYPHINGRAITDSAPTFDREWARMAGLGYCGKSSLLIHPRLGSYILIGLLILDQDVSIYADSNATNIPAATDHSNCGACTKCIEACPNKAILGNGHIDANKCIAYQTNTKRESPDIFTSNYIFGCDECLKVCPRNRQALSHSLILNHDKYKAISPNNTLNNAPKNDNTKYNSARSLPNFDMSAQQWLDMTKSEFKANYSHTPMGHLGYKRFLKNVEHYINQLNSTKNE